MSEINSLVTNKIFIEVSKMSVKKKILRVRQIFKIKDDDRYKTRLVIRGFEQRYKIYYTNTYASVMNLTTIRILLTVVTYLNLYIHMLDVKTTFLNSILSKKKRIYIKILDAYSKLSDNTIALLLLKSLYNLY